MDGQTRIQMILSQDRGKHLFWTTLKSLNTSYHSKTPLADLISGGSKTSTAGEWYPQKFLLIGDSSWKKSKILIYSFEWYLWSCGSCDMCIKFRKKHWFGSNSINLSFGTIFNLVISSRPTKAAHGKSSKACVKLAALDQT